MLTVQQVSEINTPAPPRKLEPSNIWLRKACQNYVVHILPCSLHKKGENALHGQLRSFNEEYAASLDLIIGCLDSRTNIYLTI